MECCPVQAHCNHLFERMLVGTVDVAAGWEGVTMMVFVHIFIHRGQVHEPMDRSVQHVVANEDHPHSAHSVEEPKALGRAVDEERVPSKEDQIGCEYELDERVDEEVHQVSRVNWVLVWLGGALPRGQLG
eukprot:scaffold58218_cov34-Tisochrysis_lutea.AAC.2